MKEQRQPSRKNEKSTKKERNTTPIIDKKLGGPNRPAE